MAAADWTELTGALSGGSADRGVTAGIARPPGGGSFLFGVNTLDTTPGVVGYFTNQVNFAPMSKGGSIRGCLQRGPSGGPTNFAPFLYLGLQGPTTGDNAYILGLSDADPHRIALRKGKISDGLPDVAVGASGILRKSTATYAPAKWLQLRLDMIVNLNGDVVLNAYANDLDVHDCTSPVWTPIPGIAQFIDDALGINSGSAPYTSGRAGFAMQTKDVTRRAFFDQIEVQRQL